MVESTWEWDLAVLEAVAELEEVQVGADPDDVADRLDVPGAEVLLSVKRLASGAYLEYRDSSTMEGLSAYDARPTGIGRRVVGQWPNENVAYEELLQLLTACAGAEQDPDRRQALEDARGFLEAAGAAAVGGVLHSLWRVLAGM